MPLLGTPFQACYALPVENALSLAREIIAACDDIGGSMSR
jgi:hypothetical protein